MDNFNPDNFKNNNLYKIDLSNIDMRTHIPMFNTSIPQFKLIEKDQPKPKKGIEGWYERNTGKITLFFASTSIIEGIIIFFLSQ